MPSGGNELTSPVTEGPPAERRKKESDDPIDHMRLSNLARLPSERTRVKRVARDNTASSLREGSGLMAVHAAASADSGEDAGNKHNTRKMGLFARFRSKANHLLQDGLEALGRVVVAHPKRVIIFSVLFSLFLGLGLLVATFETDLEKSYVPESLSERENQLYLDEFLGRKPRVQNFIATTRERVNLLTKENMGAVMALHDTAEALSVGSVSYEDVCLVAFEGGPCLSRTLLQFFNENSTRLLSSFDDGSFFPTINSLKEHVTPFLGGLRYDSGGDIVAASHVRFYYELKPAVPDNSLFFPEANPDLDRALAWELAFIDQFKRRLQTASPGSGLFTTCFVERALTDEVRRNVTDQTIFLAASIVLMILYMSLILGSRTLVESRVLLGLASIANVGLAMVAGFGVSAFLVPMTDISLLLVFLGVGVGVDDVIILVDAFDRTDIRLPLTRRIPESLRLSGSTMFLTSATNIIAFAAAAAVDLPAVAWFCVNAAFVLAFLYIFTITFFTALLALDGRRQQEGRSDCLPCIQLRPARPIDEYAVTAAATDRGRAGSSSDEVLKDGNTTTTSLPPASGEVEQFHSGVFATMIHRFTKIVILRPVAVLAVLLVLALAAVSVAYVGDLPIGISLEDSFPDDSYASEHISISKEFFNLDSVQLDIVVRDEDFAAASTLSRLRSMSVGFEASKLTTPPITSWLRVFDGWRDQNATAAALPFYTALDDFLVSDPLLLNDTVYNPKSYQKDLSFHDDGTLRASRSIILFRVSSTTQGRIDDMRAGQALFRRYGVSGFVATFHFQFSARDDVVIVLIIQTLAVAALAVTILLLFFLDPRLVVVITSAIVLLDAILTGAMYVLDIPIDVISFILLTIAIGLSVDYIVHLAHAYEHAVGDKYQKVAFAMNTAGISVFKGAFSTFLGTVVLGFTTAEVFRLFFKMLVSIVILGMYFGLVYFPAIMSLFGWGTSSEEDVYAFEDEEHGSNALLPSGSSAEMVPVASLAGSDGRQERANGGNLSLMREASKISELSSLPSVAAGGKHSRHTSGDSAVSRSSRPFSMRPSVSSDPNVKYGATGGIVNDDEEDDEEWNVNPLARRSIVALSQSRQLEDADIAGELNALQPYGRVEEEEFAEDGGYTGQLRIILHCAALREDAGIYGEEDPYLVCSVGGAVQKTSIHEGGGNDPVWDHEMKFRILPKHGSVKVSLHDADNNDLFLCEGEWPMKAVIEGNGVTCWMDVHFENRNAGKVQLTASFEGTDKEGEEIVGADIYSTKESLSALAALAGAQQVSYEEALARLSFAAPPAADDEETDEETEKEEEDAKNEEEEDWEKGREEEPKESVSVSSSPIPSPVEVQQTEEDGKAVGSDSNIDT